MTLSRAIRKKEEIKKRLLPVTNEKRKKIFPESIWVNQI